MFDNLGVGIGPLPNGSPGGGGLVCFPMELYETPILDLTIVTPPLEFIPARPGLIALPTSNSRFVIEQVAGAQTVPLTFRVTQDLINSNFANSTTVPSNADVNGGVVPFISGGANISSLTNRRFPNTPFMFQMLTGAQGTGGFVLRGKFVTVVGWAAVGS